MDSDRLEQKLDKLSDAISDIKAMLAADKEAQVGMKERVSRLEKDVEPIQKRMSMLEGLFIFLGVPGVAAALFSYFKK